jgi:CheY-like chemotaxis protein
MIDHRRGWSRWPTSAGGSAPGSAEVGGADPPRDTSGGLHKALYALVMLPTSELVSRIRVATGDTQEGLARRLGVSFPTINSWERGRSEPKQPRRLELEQLAASLGIRQELMVLVIDDDPVTAELVRAAAHDLDAAVTVEAAPGGWEGLIMCGSLQPQLLFLDVMMPGIDGLEVARRLPSISGLGPLRVVFATSSQSADVLARASALGSEVLAKPLELDDLTRVMSQALAQASAA